MASYGKIGGKMFSQPTVRCKIGSRSPILIIPVPLFFIASFSNGYDVLLKNIYIRWFLDELNTT
jgi:hypothetical protein